MITSKTALIVTGQFRSFEKIIDQLDQCIIKPNNAVLFILCATTDQSQLKQLIESRNIHIGGIITAESFKNHEYEQIFKMIKNSNRSGLTEEVFTRSNFSFNYLENGGSILQYYQFWKIWFKVLEYERMNNVRFDNCIRVRTDTLFGKKIIVEDFFNEEKFKKLFEDYTCTLYEENHYGDKTIFNIDAENTIITYAVEFVWFGKRCVFDRLSQIIFHYGLWDSGQNFTFNSESTFHQFCKNYNLYHICLVEKGWPMNVYNLEEGLKYTCSILR